MTAAHLSIDAVLDRLAEGPWRLEGLPTLRGQGLYFVAVDAGDDATFAWFDLTSSLSASRTTFFDRPGAATFLARYERDGYDAALLGRWESGASPSPERLRAALRRTRRLIGELRAEPGSLAPAMETGWMERTPELGWVVTKVYETGARPIQCSETRAASELLGQILRHDEELERGTPSAEDAAAIATTREQRATFFGDHGPTTDRALLRSRPGTAPRGLVKLTGGLHAEIALSPEGELRAAELLPDDHAFEQLANELRSVMPPRSMALPDAAREPLERLLDPVALAAWHERGEIELRCGDFARGGFHTLDRDTLLDSLTDERLPVADALERFGGGRGFVAVEVTPALPPSEAARVRDDDDASSVRYTFPKVWLQRLSRERVFELAFGTALTAALGTKATPERTQEWRKQGDGRADALRVTLRAGAGKVVIDEEPIESGHGVHGSRARATFHGLPDGLKLSGSGRIDMRAGGHLELTVEGDPEGTIERAVLDALP